MTDTTSKPDITRAGVLRGIGRGLPLFASGVVYGLAFGSVAAGIGLSLLETLLMSALVYSGSAQFAIAGVWSPSLGMFPAALIVLVANVRYIVMSASLRPWLGDVSAWRVYPMLAFLVDGAYALGVKSRAAGDADGGVLFGSALMSFTGWMSAISLGYVSGRMLADPRAVGLDFVVIAFCVAAAVGLAQQAGTPRRLLPAVIAAGVIVLVERLAPGPWTVVAAGIVAAIAAAVLFRPDEAAA